MFCIQIGRRDYSLPNGNLIIHALNSVDSIDYKFRFCVHVVIPIIYRVFHFWLFRPDIVLLLSFISRQALLYFSLGVRWSLYPESWLPSVPFCTWRQGKSEKVRSFNALSISTSQFSKKIEKVELKKRSSIVLK